MQTIQIVFTNSEQPTNSLHYNFIIVILIEHNFFFYAF